MRKRLQEITLTNYPESLTFNYVYGFAKDVEYTEIHIFTVFSFSIIKIKPLGNPNISNILFVCKSTFSIFFPVCALCDMILICLTKTLQKHIQHYSLYVSFFMIL